MPDLEAVFFRTPADWRAWLDGHAADETELWVGFHKRGSGETCISWPESVDQALCFGWIDGRRQSIDATRYRIRFSPRKASSIWSTVNIARVAELEELGLMRAAGLEAFARRREARSGIYSHEQAGEPELEASHEARFKQRPEAWDFFQAQAPSYRKAALWWVVNAKRAETRERRLATLIEDSAAGRRAAHLQRQVGRA
ncbi:MAG: YdeI/OmpD-associated family protein [Actinomycetota bacterium]|nr:YdeI/OmpD-associated family protein [Actinomycetota bacterium]